MIALSSGELIQDRGNLENLDRGKMTAKKLKVESNISAMH